MCGEREPESVAHELTARAEVERPAVGPGGVEADFVRSKRRAEVSAGDATRPRRPNREGVDGNRGARRIGAVDRLRQITQTDAPVDQADLSEPARGGTDGRDDAIGIDRGWRLNGFERELQLGWRALRNLRRIPERRRGAGCECGWGGQGGRGDAPQGRARRLL